MQQYQRTPEQIRDLVIAEIRSHTSEAVPVPLPVPVPGDGVENGANWKMLYSGDWRFAEAFYAAVRWAQRRWDAYEPAGAAGLGAS
jgi:hypothetical protein